MGPWLGLCEVFFGKIRYSHSTSLHLGIKMGSSNWYESLTKCWGRGWGGEPSPEEEGGEEDDYVDDDDDENDDDDDEDDDDDDEIEITISGDDDSDDDSDIAIF